MFDLSLEERKKLFQDPLIQKLIEAVIKGNPSELKPSYDTTKGYHYIEIDKITGDNNKSELILKQLSDSNILDKKFYDKTIVCPDCGSIRIGFRYLCPRCESGQIDRKSLLEHVKCGGIDSVDRFQQEGKLVCFQCNAELNKDDPELKGIGSWFYCSSCNARFDEPAMRQHCMDCEREFTIRDADFKSLFLYSLNKEIMTEYKRESTIFSQLKPTLEKLGYSVEIGGVIKGKSGTEYRFDLLMREKGTKNPIVIDVIMESKPIGAAPVSSMFAKVYDIKSDRQILIAIPKLDEEGLKLTKLYKIEVIEATNLEEAINKLSGVSKSPKEQTPEEE